MLELLEMLTKERKQIVNFVKFVRGVYTSHIPLQYQITGTVIIGKIPIKADKTMLRMNKIIVIKTPSTKN